MWLGNNQTDNKNASVPSQHHYAQDKQARDEPVGAQVGMDAKTVKTR